LKRFVFVFATLAAAAVFSESAGGDVVLYDVEFGSPAHTVGAPPMVGFGAIPRTTPTSQRAATVESSVDGLSGPAVSFLPKAGSTSGVSFWLGSGSDPRTGDPGLDVQFPAYAIEMDVAVQALLESSLPGDDPDFKIELEAPLPHQLRFTRDRIVRAITFDDSGISETRVGTFAFGQPIHLRLLAELTAHRWSIDIDGVRAFTGAFPNEGSLWNVNVVLNRTSLIAAAGIDNVRITGVPEPTVGLLLAVGLWALRRASRNPVRRP